MLGLFEIGVFIALPIAQEVAAWWGLRREIIARRRARWTAVAFAVTAILLFAPWIRTVEVPAVLTAAEEEAIYLPFAARLAKIEVVEGQMVREGRRPVRGRCRRSRAATEKSATRSARARVPAQPGACQRQGAGRPRRSREQAGSRTRNSRGERATAVATLGPRAVRRARRRRRSRRSRPVFGSIRSNRSRDWFRLAACA